MVQEHLGPSLLSTYIAVDQIEGLDVDKEEFDKYGARLVGEADMQLKYCIGDRYEIARLLEQLWGRVDCKESILKQTKSQRFQVVYSVCVCVCVCMCMCMCMCVHMM